MLLELFENCNKGIWKTAYGDTQYKIEDNVLYFSGSNSLSDWISNFDFPITSYKDGPIEWKGHRGFILTWKYISNIIIKEIIDNKVDMIVGYSRGASLALLAHEYCVFNNIPVISYVFGCPRVIWMPNKKLLSRWDGFTRVKVRGDIVTNVPPWLFGYRHVGNEIEIGPNKIILLPRNHMPNKYIEYLKGK